jgi:uncharacterized protein RhaS with RHS repeats
LTGRYIQSDPIGFDGGVSTFVYVTGNPVVLVDFEGLDLDWGKPFNKYMNKIQENSKGLDIIVELMDSKTKYKIVVPRIGKMSSYYTKDNTIYLTPGVKVNVNINDNGSFFNNTIIYDTDIILFHELVHAYLDDKNGNPGTEMFVIKNYENKYSGHNRVNHHGSYVW